MRRGVFDLLSVIGSVGFLHAEVNSMRGMHATHLTDELGRLVIRSQNFLVQSRGILILQTPTALHAIQSGANAWALRYETLLGLTLGLTASLPTFQSSKGKYPQTSAKRITPQLHKSQRCGT